MNGSFYNTVTQIVASLGVCANALLVLLILTKTPSYMRTYAYLLLSSALGDLLGLLAIIVTLPREVIYEQLLVVQFHGVCALHSESACWHSFGVLQWMFSGTCALLTASFGLRLAILSNINVSKSAVAGVSVLLVIIFSPTLWAFTNVFRIGSPHAQRPPVAALFVTNNTRLGIIDQTDGFTQFALNFTILTATLLLIISITLRSVILRKLYAVQHNMSAHSRQGHFMLIRALNIQLPVTSFYFAATIFYVLNSNGILVGDYVDYWTTPIANLQNVLTPMVNLWFIQPYRRSIASALVLKRSPKSTSTAHDESYTTNVVVL